MATQGPRKWLLALALILCHVPFSEGQKESTEDKGAKEGRKHWAFQPVKKTRLPEVLQSTWVRNPIDTFILARLEAKGLRPNPAAQPRALLRRIHLDLAGLPPTPAEQESFLGDPSEKALDRIIDSLLARPSYGERWGRHWLDLVRFAETNGYERDASRPEVWRYRDYVIRAFNEDKPYDRFVLEQLAGDELADASGETMIATGYYRLGPWDDEPADPREDRMDQLDDIVSTTSLVFMGLSLGCARCHDHKFDPLTIVDYYRMVAIFNPLQRPANGRTELVLPAGSPEQVEALTRRDRKIAELQKTASAEKKETGKYPVEIDKAIKALRLEVPDLPRGYFMIEPSPKAPDTHVLRRGKVSRPGKKVDPGFPAVLVKEERAFPPPGKRTTLRRLTLAKWIASPDHPLTARVIVNRVWQQHFGQGLVRTPSDFGVMGQPPTHPELLDWLARWFVEQGWSLKKLHRLIMTSNTYRQSAKWDKVAAAKDAENKLLWRFPYRRLEVEAIRDSALAVSGQLNRTMFGPSMFPRVPKEALAGSSDPDKIWKESSEREAARRTIYAFSKRSMVVPLLEVLDVCDTVRSADRRLVTTVAPQALTLFNGDFVNRQAQHFARRLEKEAGADPGKQIDRAYILALCRPPTATEKQVMLQFLQRESDHLRQENRLEFNAAQHLALEQLCRVIFNLNEFVYPD
jgi:uncharacterized protein DUF1553/uncharacterized protein DUF1549